MVTGSIDKTIKIWDIFGGVPKFIGERNMDCGAVYTTSFSPDSPVSVLHLTLKDCALFPSTNTCALLNDSLISIKGVIAIGGAEGGLKTVDLFETSSVQRAFASRDVKPQPRPVERRAIPQEDAPDDTEVFAVPEDPEEEDQSWVDVMRDIQITPRDESEKSSGSAKKSKAKKVKKKK